jgi:fructoselysine-6-P-deglycase FrlB-like protein
VTFNRTATSSARSPGSLLVITRSGTTTEVIDVLISLRGRDLVTTAIVATPGTPVTGLADRTILLPEVDETSVVQTRFATPAVRGHRVKPDRGSSTKRRR